MLHAGFFASGSCFFRGMQTIKNVIQLSDVVG